VAERRSNRLTLSPLHPEDAEFGRTTYPERQTAPLCHRRWFALVKHPAGAKIQDYIAVLDETAGDEPKALNVHLLSRLIRQQGNLFLATGQYGRDVRLFVASEPNPACEVRGWGYLDEWMDSPGAEYELRPGEAQEAYVARMGQLMQDHGVSTLPLKGWAPKWSKNEAWQGLAKATGHQSLIPPPA